MDLFIAIDRFKNVNIPGPIYAKLLYHKNSRKQIVLFASEAVSKGFCKKDIMHLNEYIQKLGSSLDSQLYVYVESYFNSIDEPYFNRDSGYIGREKVFSSLDISESPEEDLPINDTQFLETDKNICFEKIQKKIFVPDKSLGEDLLHILKTDNYDRFVADTDDCVKDHIIEDITNRVKKLKDRIDINVFEKLVNGDIKDELYTVVVNFFKDIPNYHILSQICKRGDYHVVISDDNTIVNAINSLLRMNYIIKDVYFGDTYNFRCLKIEDNSPNTNFYESLKYIETKEIYGPVSFEALKSDKINCLLFGTVHTDNTVTNLYRFIVECAKRCPIKLLVEKSIGSPNGDVLSNDKVINSIDELERCELLKFIPVTIIKDIGGESIVLYEFLEGLLDLINIDRDAKQFAIDVYRGRINFKMNVLHDMLSRYIRFRDNPTKSFSDLYPEYDIAVIGIKNIKYDFLLKEIRDQYTKYTDMCKKIDINYVKLLNNYKDMTVAEFTMKSNTDTLIRTKDHAEIVYCIETFGFRPLINDMFCLGEIVKGGNNIIVSGKAHCDRISRFLKDINFIDYETDIRLMT